MNNELTTIDFANDQITTVTINDTPHIPVKCLIDNLGLESKRQMKKIKENKYLNTVTAPVMNEKGHVRPQVCLPLKQVNRYLLSINPDRVKDPLRQEKVLTYQNECYDALNAYFFEGSAVRTQDGPKSVGRLNEEEMVDMLQRASRVANKHAIENSSLKNLLKTAQENYEASLLVIEDQMQEIELLEMDRDIATTIAQEAQNELRFKQALLEERAKEIEELNFRNNYSLISTTRLAELMGVSRYKLLNFLNGHSVITKRNGSWRLQKAFKQQSPTLAVMVKGYDNMRGPFEYMKWTPEGQRFVVRLWTKYNGLRPGNAVSEEMAEEAFQNMIAGMDPSYLSNL